MTGATGVTSATGVSSLNGVSGESCAALSSGHCSTMQTCMYDTYIYIYVYHRSYSPYHALSDTYYT